MKRLKSTEINMKLEKKITRGETLGEENGKDPRMGFDKTLKLISIDQIMLLCFSFRLLRGSDS